MKITEIKEGDTVLARHIPAGADWPAGLKFFSSDEEYIQVGTWGYDSGTLLKAHIHNQVPREALWTQEVLYVRKGSVRANVYDTAERKVAELVIRTGDIAIFLRGGHGYEILQDGTEILEVKNGPYVGAERDRRRF